MPKNRIRQKNRSRQRRLLYRIGNKRMAKFHGSISEVSSGFDMQDYIEDDAPDRSEFFTENGNNATAIPEDTITMATQEQTMQKMMQTMMETMLAEVQKQVQTAVGEAVANTPPATATATATPSIPEWQFVERQSHRKDSEGKYTIPSGNFYIDIFRINAARDGQVKVGEYVKDVDSGKLRTAIVAASPVQRPALKRQETGDYEHCGYDKDGSKKLWLGCRMTDEIWALITTAKATTAKATTAKAGRTSGTTPEKLAAATRTAELKRENPDWSGTQLMNQIAAEGFRNASGNPYDNNSGIHTIRQIIKKFNL